MRNLHHRKRNLALLGHDFFLFLVVVVVFSSDGDVDDMSACCSGGGGLWWTIGCPDVKSAGGEIS
uniref:Uncharacterized protein n=1 Tax=Leersia perrieri TaxID=77586 RepID=A0A0D9V926_9ORYZ